MQRTRGKEVLILGAFEEGVILRKMWVQIPPLGELPHNSAVLTSWVPWSGSLLQAAHTPWFVLRRSQPG